MRAFAVASVAILVVAAPCLVATKSLTVNTPLDTVYRWVGRVQNAGGVASGVAIGPRTVLTARHVGEGSFLLDGQTYTVVSSFRPPDAPDPRGGVPSKVDILLLNVDRDLPGYYRLATLVRPGDPGVVVGYGASGRVGSNGLSYQTPVPIGERRAGSAGGVTAKIFASGIGHCFYSDLKAPGQAIVIAGDSGGGWFVGGRLAGTISFNYNDSEVGTNPAIYPPYGFPAANTSGYVDSAGTAIPAGTAYCGSGAVDLTRPEIRAWIADKSYRPVTP